MKIEEFRVAEGAKFKLKNYKPSYTGNYKDKEVAKTDLGKNISRLAELQDVLYAHNRYALLLVFQAPDAAGKDGAIKHVMSGLNPQGVHVASFKQPSEEERDHDYLWRISKNLPERGRIGIFNRSHYEEVLVVRVHPEILQSQSLPDEIRNDKNIWKKRFEQIRNYENYLFENGIHVLKFYLNISKDEQKKRFLERIEQPEKNWKFAASDVRERGFWDEYMKAYEESIAATSTKNSPWFVIPADKKWFTRLAISEIIVKKLESLKLEYPKVSEKQAAELNEARKVLEAER